MGGNRTPMQVTAVGLGAPLAFLSIKPWAQVRLAVARLCTPDIERLWGIVEPGQGPLKACMRQLVQEVSPGGLDMLLKALAVEKESA
jgi:hypothetical protein